MKNMKRLISTLLMLSMMAALLCVPAFAAETDVFTLTGPASVDGNTPNAIVKYTAVLRDVAGNPVANKAVTWYKNGGALNVDRPTDGKGETYVEFQVSGINDGDVFKAVATSDGFQIESNAISVVKYAAVTTPDVKLEQKYASVVEGDKITLQASVNGARDNSLVSWQSLNPQVATVANGVVTGVKPGQADIVIADLTNGVEYARCPVTVTAKDTSKVSVVTITPFVYELQKNQSININASVSGDGRFDHWYVADNMGSYVSIANTNAASTTLTALSTTSLPIKLYAYSDDGASAYIEFAIVQSESLVLEVAPPNISTGETSTVYVVNPFGGEQFTWNIVPSEQYGVLNRSNNLGSAVELTAGPVEGRINITAISKSDSSRTASATVYVNTEAAYGGASITPAVATWQRGQAALKFGVSPAYYYAWLDGKALTPESKSYTYYNGVLTLSTGLLSTLSSGEHTLKVQTSSGNGQDGLVYATIYVTGSASNVYGDNAHVRGSAYNLYFTSTDPIKEVYISNQWIDPANYSLTNNGTALTLHSDFLNKLGYGSYSMRLVTQNGYNQNASFRIVTANYAPATGDDANMGAWMALLALSLAGAVALIPKRKKSTDLIG